MVGFVQCSASCNSLPSSPVNRLVLPPMMYVRKEQPSNRKGETNWRAITHVGSEGTTIQQKRRNQGNRTERRIILRTLFPPKTRKTMTNAVHPILLYDQLQQRSSGFDVSVTHFFGGMNLCISHSSKKKSNWEQNSTKQFNCSRKDKQTYCQKFTWVFTETRMIQIVLLSLLFLGISSWLTACHRWLMLSFRRFGSVRFVSFFLCCRCFGWNMNLHKNEPTWLSNVAGVRHVNQRRIRLIEYSDYDFSRMH